jgi:ATP-binding cassette subfamily C protein LapB
MAKVAQISADNRPRRSPFATISGLYQRLQPPKSLQKLWFAKLIKVPKRIIVATFVINLLGLAMPIVILQIYDRIIPNLAYVTLSYLIFGLVVAFAIDTTLKIIRSHIAGWSAAHIDYLCSTEAVRRVFRGDLREIEKDNASTHIDRMNAISATAKMFAGPARLGLIDLPFIFIFLGAMLVIAPTLAGAVLALFVVFAFQLLSRMKKIQQLNEERQDLDRRNYDFVIEALSGLDNIKTMSCEPQMMRRYERLQEAIATAFHKTVRIDGVTQSMSNVFASATMVVIVSLGAYLVINSMLSIGALACCLLLGGRSVEVLVRSVRTWGELSNFDLVKKNVDEIFALGDGHAHEKPELSLHKSNINFSNVKVELENDNTALINLSIEEGEIFGLKGSNSSDDKALLAIMRGMDRPKSGVFTIGGHSASELVASDLSTSVAYVPQHAAIFRGTILENLTLFNVQDGLNAARAATRLIGLEADIQHLPMGYDTLLGSGGNQMLPPSFQQRICIARALARRPKLLILEEANAVLDQRAERLLQRGLEALKGSTTMVILSNRPSFLKLADRCMQLKDGGLVPFEFNFGQPKDARHKTEQKRSAS